MGSPDEDVIMARTSPDAIEDAYEKTLDEPLEDEVPAEAPFPETTVRFESLDFEPEREEVDRFDDPNPDGAGIDYLPLATNAKYTFVLAGVEYYLFRSVRISPNIEWVTYDALTNDPQIKDTVVPRVTFYWIW